MRKPPKINKIVPLKKGGKYANGNGAGTSDEDVVKKKEEQDALKKTGGIASLISGGGLTQAGALGAAGVTALDQQDHNTSIAGDAGATALSMAGQGAQLGMLAGPEGAIAGAAIGGALGLGLGAYKGKKANDAEIKATSDDIHADAAAHVGQANYTATSPLYNKKDLKSTLGIRGLFAKGGEIKGAGGPKDDKINAKVERKSFIVPAEYAALAEKIRSKYLGDKTDEAEIKQPKGVPVKLSNGEHLFTPEEVEELTEKGIDLNKLAPNSDSDKKLADGGGVGDDKIKKAKKVDQVPEGYRHTGVIDGKKYYEKEQELPDATQGIMTTNLGVYDKTIKDKLASGVTVQQLIDKKYITPEKANIYAPYYKPSNDIIYTEESKKMPPSIQLKDEQRIDRKKIDPAFPGVVSYNYPDPDAGYSKASQKHFYKDKEIDLEKSISQDGKLNPVYIGNGLNEGNNIGIAKLGRATTTDLPLTDEQIRAKQKGMGANDTSVAGFSKGGHVKGDKIGDATYDGKDWRDQSGNKYSEDYISKMEKTNDDNERKLDNQRISQYQKILDRDKNDPSRAVANASLQKQIDAINQKYNPTKQVVNPGANNANIKVPGARKVPSKGIPDSVKFVPPVIDPNNLEGNDIVVPEGPQAVTKKDSPIQTDNEKSLVDTAMAQQEKDKAPGITKEQERANNLQLLGTIASTGQAGLGLATLLKDGKRPVDKIDPTFDKSVNDAQIRAQTGLSPEQRAILDSENLQTRNLAIDNINNAAGGNGAVALANTRGALNDSYRNSLNVAATDQEMRQNKRTYADQLLMQRAEMKRRLFGDKMAAFEQNQNAGANLLGAGIRNYIGSMRYGQELQNNKKVEDQDNSYLKGLPQ